MNQQERRTAISAMLLVVTAEAGTTNELIKNFITGKRKRERRGGPKQNTTVYAILGKRVYMASFTVFVQISHQKVMRLAAEIAENGYDIHRPALVLSRSGLLSLNTLIHVQFLK